MEFFTENNRHL